MLRRTAVLTRGADVLETGEFEAIITTGQRDAYQDELVPEGADLAIYESNPVLLHLHDPAAPIGRAVSLTRLADRITGRFKLLSRGVSAVADQARSMIAEGALNCISVGFDPLEDEPIEGAGKRYLKWRLHEISTVTLPANPGAIITVRSSEDPPMTTTAPAPAAAPTTVHMTRQIRTLSEHVRESSILENVARSGRGRAEFALSLRTIGTNQASGADPQLTPTPQS